MHHQNIEAHRQVLQQRPGFWVTGLQFILCVMRLSLLLYTSRMGRSDFSWPVGTGRGCSSPLKHSHTCMAPSSPQTCSGSFCWWQQNSPGSVADAGDMVKWQLWRWQLLLGEDGETAGKNVSVLLVLPPLAFLCKEVGARAHPVAGKIVSFAVLRSLREDVGALLSYSKTPHQAEWTKRSPLQMGSGGRGLHLVVGLVGRAPKDSREHRQHFCSGCCTSALVMTELWQNFCLDFHF